MWAPRYFSFETDSLTSRVLQLFEGCQGWKERGSRLITDGDGPRNDEAGTMSAK